MSETTATSALDALLSTLRVEDGAATALIDEGWMQGRTAYGGISSAVALAATMALHPTETPLRYAQISFVGPVGGACTVRTRDVDHCGLVMPDVPSPEALAPVPEHKVRPAFSRHFDMRPVTGPRFGWNEERGEYLTWVRFVEQPACHPAVAMLAMGDALPPAAMALFKQFGPISSMNWTVNMLTGTPATDDGWWLLSARTDHARGGFSVQDMLIWNRAGEAVLSGSQGVAIYV